MADSRPEDEHRVPLAEVLRALGEELEGVTAGALSVDTATLELDVTVETGADGRPAFRVPGAQGRGKRSRAARLSLTLRARAAAPATEPGSPAVPGRPTSDTGNAAHLEHWQDAEDRERPSEARDAPAGTTGLLDLLADALRTVSRAASTGDPRTTTGRGSGPAADGPGPLSPGRPDGPRRPGTGG